MRVAPNPNPATGPSVRRVHERARAAIIVLLLAGIALGFCAGALLVRSQGKASRTPSGSHSADQNATSTLAESSRLILSNLTLPVQIRFYALLTPADGADATREFATRVDHLLSAFEREAGGKLLLERHQSVSDATLDAAAAAGLRPFNLGKGSSSYLGIVVERDDQRELFAQLSRQWEPALEYDLSRAIERVGRSANPGRSPTEVSRASQTTLSEVRRLIPNLDAIPAQEATRILREAALKEFSAAAQEMEAQLLKSQERLNAGQAGQSEASQQAALGELRDLQARQSARLKEIAARLQDQIAAVEQLKAATRP
jgi:hypothetical protein